MKRLACAFAVVSLALTGCSGSLCEDFKDVSEDLEEKAAPCSDGTSGGSNDEFNVQQCESDLSKCSDDDREALRDYIDCLDNVDKCVKGKEDAFGGAILGCAFTAAGKLSDACTSTVSQDVRRTVERYSVSR